MSESEKFIRHLSVSWDDLHRHSRQLAALVRHEKSWKGIIAITRGGLAPAGIIAYELDLRYIETLCISSYDHQTQRDVQVLKPFEGDGENMLVIEDIVDTGVTAKLVRELHPKAYFASIFAKPQGKPHVDKFLIEIEQDIWVDFPWDNPA